MDSSGVGGSNPFVGACLVLFRWAECRLSGLIGHEQRLGLLAADRARSPGGGSCGCCPGPFRRSRSPGRPGCPGRRWPARPPCRRGRRGRVGSPASSAIRRTSWSPGPGRSPCPPTTGLPAATGRSPPARRPTARPVCPATTRRSGPAFWPGVLARRSGPASRVNRTTRWPGTDSDAERSQVRQMCDRLRWGAWRSGSTAVASDSAAALTLGYRWRQADARIAASQCASTCVLKVYREPRRSHEFERNPPSPALGEKRCCH